ncbi:ABC transporter permease [Micromonospora sp. NBC_00898]|uniref:ABC transporter permease n=1 Tax=Micromonospora sp. NBC_00898 TaxID=2975981 RepID=UPI0038683E8E|nr:ABC transporter permease [Micromonospora sp. NBC_00898]
MSAALYAEWVKLVHSRLWWITLLAITVGAAAGGLFMFISLHPDKARDLGLLGAKAQLATLDPTWPSYLGLLAQIAAVGGIGVFGMIIVWIFGREFADHTAKDLLALPTRRGAVVAAKFTVASVWCLALTVYLLAAGTAIGTLLGIPGLDLGTWASGAGRLIMTAALTIGLSTVFGLAASIGRGYLAAVGVLFAVLFTAQIVAALGYGPWFAFSVPALHAGITGDQDHPTAAGYASVALVAILSGWATARWWQRADHAN